MRDYVVLDVFTRVPLQGNPVAVFLDAAGLSAQTMQRAARELNLSETVFLFAGDGEADARLRIFTPAVELPFAGHPVLGTAFVVGTSSGGETVTLGTGAGLVPVALTRAGDAIEFGEMAQPLPVAESFSASAELFTALGVAGSEVPVGAWRNGPLHLYVQLPDAAAVDALAPDVGALARVVPGGVSCYAVTAPGRVHSRMFGPALGVTEDPATGSAAGPLAVHLATHGVCDWGTEIEIDQGVAMGRPSRLHARALGGEDGVERVLVGGSAVHVAQGRYRLD
jgi:trans-2,3-dihydro-3-hydroxyanthranilate isomerase